MAFVLRDYVPQITAVLSLGYGIFATIWDFHSTNQRNEKTLSKAGRIAIVALIGLAVWNGIVEYNKHKEDDKKSRDRDAVQTKIARDLAATTLSVENTVNSLSETLGQAKIAAETSRTVLGQAKKTARTSSQILEQVNRSLEPLALLTEGNISFTIRGSMIDSYADRVKGREFLTLAAGVSIGPRQDDYPNPMLNSEEELSSFLERFDDVTVIFQEPDQSVALEIQIQCNRAAIPGNRDPRTIRSVHYSNGPLVSYRCEGAIAEVFSAESKYKSITDLDGLTVRLYGREWMIPQMEDLSIVIGQPRNIGSYIRASDFKAFSEKRGSGTDAPSYGLSGTAHYVVAE